MLTIGLTGGIASGKSTIADYFSQLGVEMVDADVVAREIVEPGEPVLDNIIEHFGAQIVSTVDGSLDRAQLRKIIFEAPNERKWLESKMHPAIRERIIEKLAAMSGDYRLLVVPLLIESKAYGTIADRILVVDIPESLQLERIQQRDGGTIEQAQAIVDAQMSRDERLTYADDVIDNTQSLHTVFERVKELDTLYRQLSKASS